MVSPRASFLKEIHVLEIYDLEERSGPKGIL
jgi:hypothetical protein